MYSQNNEDELMLAYFNSKNKSVLEIGANDGKTLSNSLLFIENGWRAHLIEPSKKAFDCLLKLHGQNQNVHIYNVAISDVTETKKYYESGALLGADDYSLVSSLDENELKRWGGSVDFVETTAECVSWNDFIKFNKLKTTQFNLISIDAEGYDWIILQQIDLCSHNCEMLCVEWNGIKDNDIKFTEYANRHNLFEIHRNAENIIFAKKNN